MWKSGKSSKKTIHLLHDLHDFGEPSSLGPQNHEKWRFYTPIYGLYHGYTPSKWRFWVPAVHFSPGFIDFRWLPLAFFFKAIPMSKFELRDDEISGKRGFVLEHNGYDEGRGLCQRWEGVENGRGFTRGSFNGTHIGGLKQMQIDFNL